MSSEAMDQQALPSFMQIINCGYCAKSMRRKNLKDHTSRCHKGHPPVTAEGEALKRLLDELRIQREKETERKALARLAAANEKRLEKDRLKVLEKEQEIQQQKELEAQRKEQEEARKKKKRETLRLEKRQSKCIGSGYPSKSNSSTVTATQADKSSLGVNAQEAANTDASKTSCISNETTTEDASCMQSMRGRGLNPHTTKSSARENLIGESYSNDSSEGCIGAGHPFKSNSSTVTATQADKSSHGVIAHEAANKDQSKATSISKETTTEDASCVQSMAGRGLNLHDTKSSARRNLIRQSYSSDSSDKFNSIATTSTPSNCIERAKGLSQFNEPIIQNLRAQVSPQSQSFSSDAEGSELIGQSNNCAITEFEMRRNFKEAKTMEEVLNLCPNFEYDDAVGSIKCVQCSFLKQSKPIHHHIKPDDSKSLQLAKFRDTKKKLLDHLYKSSTHQSNVQPLATQTESDINVECGTRVMRAIYGKIKSGGGYKSIEQAISEKAADDLAVGNINHGRHFASSMTAPIYEAVKQRVQKSIKRLMPGTGQPPPFCLIADKMTPARSTLQIVGVITPNPETGKLQSICLGVKECYDGTGLGTTEEMVTCLKEYFSTAEIHKSLVGVAVDGAYHHHNIKDHLPSVLDFSSEKKELFATSWDASHLIELAAQKSRGQNSKDRAITTPWIKSTFDTVTAVKTYAGRGKNWKELQDNASLAEARSLRDEDGLLHTIRNKPLKKFQSFSNTRFARFSQRVLGNMRENFKATCGYLESKSKEGCGLLNKLARPDFALRLCGLDDIYDHIGRASERLQSSTLYGWNTIEILEETTNTMKEMAASLHRGDQHAKMHQFNLAATEISTSYTYQGVSLQGQSANADTDCTLAKAREDLADHITSFTQDLDRRTQEQTPKICQISREAFSLQRIINRPEDSVPPEFDEITKLSTAAGICDKKLTREDWHREYNYFARAVRTEKSALEIEGNCEGAVTGQVPVGVEEALYSKFFTNKQSTEKFTNLSYLLCRSALQSSCEAVTEGMGSVVKKTLEGRENMAITKLSQEVFIRLNGPKSNRNCNGILREAGDIRFGDRTKWHFVSSPKAKYKGTSKVLSRLSNEDERFNFESDTDEEC